MTKHKAKRIVRNTRAYWIEGAAKRRVDSLVYRLIELDRMRGITSNSLARILQKLLKQHESSLDGPIGR